MSTTSGSTSGVTPADYEAYLWQSLFNLAEHAYYHLDETACFKKEEQMHYKNMIDVANDLYNQVGEDKKAQAKTIVVEILWNLIDALLGCG